MKRFNEFVKENIKENYEEYDDMSIRELKIACYTSQKILEMVENGGELERWNLSKITLAADYLTSVYTFMQSNMDTEQEYDDSGYDSPFDGNY
jgi:hypothetical protein